MKKTLSAESLYQLHLWLRSDVFKETGRKLFYVIVVSTIILVLVFFGYPFLDVFTKMQGMSPQERIDLKMAWELNILDSPDFRFYFAGVLAAISLSLVKIITERGVDVFSIYLCQLAGKMDHIDARFSYAEYCLQAAKYPIEFDLSQKYGKQRFSRVPFYGIPLLNRLGPGISSFLDRNFFTPRQKRLLTKALNSLNALSPEHEKAGEGAYLAGLIHLRGLEIDTTLARKNLEFAVGHGIPFAYFELALMLLEGDDVNDRITALELLEKKKKSLQPGNMQNRALFELAKLECVQLGTKMPDLRKAQAYLQEIQADENMALLFHIGADSESGLSGQVISLDETVAEAKILLIKVTEQIHTETQRKLAEAEREKREAIENMMAMFAHKFRGPVDSILFNTSHQHDERVYVDAARTMNGLLDIFSVVSTHPDKLLGNLKDDMGGEGSPCGVLLHAIKLALVQLLSLRNRRRMSPHYLAYAKKHGKAPEDLRLSAWAQEKSWQEMEKSLQILWEQEVGEMIVTASLDVMNDWMKTHLLPIRVEGFEESKTQFAQYGPKASLLTVIFTEVLVNAIKHAAPAALEPIELSWCEGDEETIFSCVNPSSRESRTREASKGSGRGHKFLSLIADHLHGHFDADVFRDESRVSMTLPSSAMTGDAK